MGWFSKKKKVEEVVVEQEESAYEQEDEGEYEGDYEGDEGEEVSEEGEEVEENEAEASKAEENEAEAIKREKKGPEDEKSVKKEEQPPKVEIGKKEIPKKEEIILIKKKIEIKEESEKKKSKQEESEVDEAASAQADDSDSDDGGKVDMSKKVFVLPEHTAAPGAAWHKILLRLLFLVSFSTSMYLAHGSEYGFFMLRNFDHQILQRHALNEKYSTDTPFHGITRIEDIYLWMKGPLIKTLLQEYYPWPQTKLNDFLENYDESLCDANITDSFPPFALPSPQNSSKNPPCWSGLRPKDERFYALGYNKLMTRITIRQSRRVSTSCSQKAPFDTYPFPQMTCLGDEDTAPFTSDGNPNATNPYPDETYSYLTADQTQSMSEYGVIKFYPAGGYRVDLPNNLSEATEVLNGMEATNWIDVNTEYIIVRFWTYNPNLGLVYNAEISLEAATGGWIGKADQQVLLMNKYESRFSVIMMVFEVTALASSIFTLIDTLLEFHTHGCRKHCTNGVNIVEYLSILLFMAVMIVRLFSVHSFNGININSNAVINISYAVFAVKVEDYIAAFMIFLSISKLFSLLGEKVPRINVFGQMLRYAIVDILICLLLFMLALFAFSFAGYISFGSNNEEFRSLKVSMVTLFRGLFFPLDWSKLERSNRSFGAFFYFAYSFAIGLIIINVFVSIIMMAWYEIQVHSYIHTYTIHTILKTYTYIVRRQT